MTDRQTGPIAAVIFDMDGVILDTTAVHAATWKHVLDAYLRERALAGLEPYAPFNALEDYARHFDGRQRYDGLRRFLDARGIALDDGDASDPADRPTVGGLANRKNELFLETVREKGVAPYPSSIEVVRALKDRGVRLAVASSSRNGGGLLEAAQLAEVFDAIVDGTVAAELGLPAKPDPAAFIEAARRLGVEPARTAVVEDTPVGVQAARDGGFGLVVGLDRGGRAAELADSGAHIVVGDLAELELDALLG